MEEIAEGALKGLLRLLGILVRAMVWLIWDLCFETIAWYVGWPICRALSFGKLPRQAITEYGAASYLAGMLVSTTGLVTLIALATLLTKLAGSG